MKTEQEQIIIEGLVTTLGYREKRIDELEAELTTWKTRAEIAERKVTFLLKRIEQLSGTVIETNSLRR